MSWIAKAHSTVPLRRTFAWSLLGHAGLVALLVVVSVLPAPRHRRRIAIASSALTIRAIPSVSDQPKPMGEDREIEVENVRPVEPPKPTPALIVKATPEPRKVIERPPDKPQVKENVAMKKVVATPTPEIKKTPAPTPVKEVKTPKPTPEAKKAAPTPTPAPAFENRPAPKGAKDGAEAPTSLQEAMRFDEDVALPDGYVADAVRRLRSNFVYPRSLDARLPGPVACIVVFKIMNDGTIKDIAVDDSSGNANLARYAIDAVAKTRFFLPLKEYTNRPYITARVPFTFGADLEGTR